jgi:hypothetical protein
MTFANRTHALQQHGENTKQNQREKDDVKKSTVRSVMTEDHLAPLIPPWSAIAIN